MAIVKWAKGIEFVSGLLSKRPKKGEKRLGESIIRGNPQNPHVRFLPCGEKPEALSESWESKMAIVMKQPLSYYDVHDAK